MSRFSHWIPGCAPAHAKRRRTLAEIGSPPILATRDQNEALSFATQVAVMCQGRFAQAGTPLTVYSQPVDEETALFSFGDVLILPARPFSPGRASCAGGTWRRTHCILLAKVGRCCPEQLSVSGEWAGESTAIIRDVDFRPVNADAVDGWARA